MLSRLHRTAGMAAVRGGVIIMLPIFLENYDYIAALDEWVNQASSVDENRSWSIHSSMAGHAGSILKVCRLAWVVAGSRYTLERHGDSVQEAVYAAIQEVTVVLEQTK